MALISYKLSPSLIEYGYAGGLGSVCYYTDATYSEPVGLEIKQNPVLTKIEEYESLSWKDKRLYRRKKSQMRRPFSKAQPYQAFFKTKHNRKSDRHR